MRAWRLTTCAFLVDPRRVLVSRLRGASAALAQSRPDAVVAADGSAQYRTVQEAINAAPQSTDANRRWVIFVKAGTYHELVYVQREKRFVALVGEDPARTIITYGLKASDLGLDGQPIGTFRTPTMYVDADDFSAENLTVQNDAGPVGQALAIRVDGDRVVFRNCRFLGWQDTMLLDRGRQYIEDSFIAGHVDFIFGGATAFFERAHVHAWRDGYLTAASTPAEQPFGFVLANGQITGDSPNVKTYLGRPWRDFAQVTFLNTRMTDVIRAAGWHNWDRPERERTARFSEFGSTGPGASAAERVAWARPLSAGEAQAITAARVLGGSDGWDPAARACASVVGQGQRGAAAASAGQRVGGAVHCVGRRACASRLPGTAATSRSASPATSCCTSVTPAAGRRTSTWRGRSRTTTARRSRASGRSTTRPSTTAPRSPRCDTWRACTRRRATIDFGRRFSRASTSCSRRSTPTAAGRSTFRCEPTTRVTSRSTTRR